VRLTSKTAYGVQALYDMAFHGAGRPVQAREVAQRQGIPLRYLEQILQELRRVGLVEAKRGPGGGYALARSADGIRLDEIVAALEGGPIQSLLSFEPAPKPRKSTSGTSLKTPASEQDELNVPRVVWRELAAQLEGLLAGITLQDLVVRAEAAGVARASAAPQMYFI
jgi:Rrf2 family protein